MRSESPKIEERKRVELRQEDKNQGYEIKEKIGGQSKKTGTIKIFHEDLEEYEVESFVSKVDQLAHNLGINIQVDYIGNIWDNLRKSEHSLFKYDRIFEKLVKIRVIRWDKFLLHEYVSPAEKSFERRRAQGIIKSYGIVYDGFGIIGVFREYLASQFFPLTYDEVPVIITNRQIATLGDDGRYHLRIAVLGHPAVISKQGLFSAPAKPKEYHIAKLVKEDEALLIGMEIEEKIRKHLPELLSPYILSAFLWINYGISFCMDRSCLFSDSHTIDELFDSKLQVQLKLCRYHKSKIDEIRLGLDKD